jgi:hypothetical protein
MIKYAAENVTKGESLATTKGQELFARNVQAHWKYKVELSKLKID